MEVAPRSTREEFVVVLGQRLRVLIDTPTETPTRTVLFLNGIGSRADMLDNLVAAFDPRFEVLRIDPPGIGGSPSFGIPYLIPQIAWLIDGAMRKLGRTRFDVIGFSWGGLLAQQLALQSQQRVDRLVLLSTNTGIVSVPGSPFAMTMVMNPLGSEALLQAGNQQIGEVLGGLARTRPDEVMEMLAPDLASAGIGFTHQLFASMSWTTLPALWMLTQETLVISGDDDPLVPTANARMIASSIVRSWVYKYAGGHFDPLLEPSLIAPRINDFLNKPKNGRQW